VTGTSLFVIVRGKNRLRPQSAELEKTAKPRGVAFGEVVIDGHNMTGRPIPREGDSGDRGHQTLAFAGCHLGEVSSPEGENGGNLLGVGEQPGLTARRFAQRGKSDAAAFIPTCGASTPQFLAAVVQLCTQFSVRQFPHALVECNDGRRFNQQRLGDFTPPAPVSDEAVRDRI
jgi:hypothetical protein